MQSNALANVSDLINFKWTELHRPNMGTLACVLEDSLRNAFTHANVKWVACPNLSEKLQFSLAAPGICGKTALLDLGSISYTLPRLRTAKTYNIRKILKCLNRDSTNSFIFGGGYTLLSSDGILDEIVMNVSFSPETMRIMNKSRFIYTNSKQRKCNVLMSTDLNPTCTSQGTFFLSEGLTFAPVLQVRAKKLRLAGCPESTFISAMQRALQSLENFVVLGGMYVAKNEGLQHIITSYDDKNHQKINNFCMIKESEPVFCTFGSNSTGILRSSQGLSLKLNNLNSSYWLSHGSRTQYISHEINDGVEFLGYFCPAETVYRIDEPSTS